MEKIMELGRIAFEAYVSAVNGVTYDNKPIPKWDDLPDHVKKGWGAAGLAATTAIDVRLAIVLDQWARRTLPRNFFRKG